MKKRKKAYRPKEVQIPALIVGVMHPKGEGRRLDAEVRFYEIMAKIENGGPWTPEELGFLTFEFKTSLLLSKKTEEKTPLEAAFIVAKVACDLVNTYVKPGTKAPTYLTEPIRYGLQMMSAVKEVTSAAEHSRAIQLAHKQLATLLSYHPAAVRIIDPEKSATWRDLIDDPMIGRSFVFLHGRVVAGYPCWERDALRFRSVEEDLKIIIEGPAVMILATPKEMTDETANNL